MKTYCKFQTYISPYMDGELSPEETAKIGRHLDSCLTCRREYKNLSALDRQLASMPSIGASEDFDARLWEKIEAMEKEKDRKRFWDHWNFSWRPALATAAGLLVLTGALMYTDRPGEGSLPIDEVSMIQKLDLLEEYEIISHLDLLENLPEIMEISEADDA